MPLCVPLLFPFLSFERCWPTLLFCNELLCVTRFESLVVTLLDTLAIRQSL